MSKFSRFRSLEAPKDKKIPYSIYQIEGKPTLIMRQATDANKPYWDGVLRRNSSTNRRLRGGRLTAAMLDETRDNDRELFAKYVVTGWKDVTDDEGNIVAFSPEDCLDFLKELPNWVFDEVRNFAADVQNFLDETMADGEATSGNLQ